MTKYARHTWFKPNFICSLIVSGFLGWSTIVNAAGIPQSFYVDANSVLIHAAPQPPLVKTKADWLQQMDQRIISPPDVDFDTEFSHRLRQAATVLPPKDFREVYRPLKEAAWEVTKQFYPNQSLQGQAKADVLQKDFRWAVSLGNDGRRRGDFEVGVNLIRYESENVAKPNFRLGQPLSGQISAKQVIVAQYDDRSLIYEITIDPVTSLYLIVTFTASMPEELNKFMKKVKTFDDLNVRPENRLALSYLAQLISRFAN